VEIATQAAGESDERVRTYAVVAAAVALRVTEQYGLAGALVSIDGLRELVASEIAAGSDLAMFADGYSRELISVGGSLERWADKMDAESAPSAPTEPEVE
jgi:hypothetical protein